MDAKIINHNGSPAICIDGKIYPPMTATVTTCRAVLGQLVKDSIVAVIKFYKNVLCLQ